MSEHVLLIGKTSYRMAFTVGAAVKLLEKHGDVPGILKALQGSDAAELCRIVPGIVSVLIEGGETHAKLLGGGTNPPPSAEDLAAFWSFSDLVSARRQAVAVIMDGLSRSVEVEPDRKNGDATKGR